jgi:hypothetical protein
VVAARSAPGQNQVEPLALLQIVDAAQALELAVRAQVQLEVGTAGGADLEAAQGDRGVTAPARLDLHPQPNPSLQHERGSDEFGAIGGGLVGDLGAAAERQGVGDLDHPRHTAQLGDEDCRVGFVALPGLDHLVRRDGEVTTA